MQSLYNMASISTIWQNNLSYTLFMVQLEQKIIVPLSAQRVKIAPENFKLPFVLLVTSAFKSCILVTELQSWVAAQLICKILS